MRRRRLPIALASIVATAISVGCGAFSALDGFSGGAEPDAGSGGESDGSPTPTPPSGSTDAAIPPDAGEPVTDATVDAGPCAAPGMTTRICDGFERSIGVVTASSPENWSNFGSVTFASDPVGPGQIASFAAGGDSGIDDSFLSFQAGDVRRATIRGRVRIVTPPASSQRQIMIVKWSGQGQIAQVTIALMPNNGLVMNEQIINGAGANHALPPLPSGWHGFTFEVDLVQDRARFAVDGVDQVPAGEVFPQLASFPATGSVTLAIGSRYSASTPYAELRFDDVLAATATQ
jgi:hypothetical protein